MNENVTLYAIFFGIIAGTFLFAYLIDRFLKKLFIKSSSFLNNDPTNYQFLLHSIRALIYIIGISIAIYSLPNMRALASSLLAGAGILAVAIGFASQHALSNIVSGLFMVLFKPFRVNDRIKIQDMAGIVEDITLRHTVIRDFENKRIIIPNSNISNEIIINSDFGDGKVIRWIDIGISYDSDLIKAKELMRDEILKHPLLIDVRTPEQINEGEVLAPVRVLSLGDSSVNLRGWAWANSQADSFLLACDLYESIKLRFDREGIEIPFPHRTLVMKDNAAKTIFEEDKTE